MQCNEETINAVVELYNEVTKAHKKPPVLAYVQSRLERGESAEIVSGHPRWSSALQFSGSVDEMQVTFVINDALPQSFQDHLLETKTQFEELLKNKFQEI